MSRTSFTSILLAAASLHLAACTEDAGPAGTARFSTLSPELRQQAYGFSVAGSFAMPQFALFGVSLGSSETDPCPGRVETGATVTFSGGCTTQGGTTYGGQLVATNVNFGSSAPLVASEPSIIEMRRWDDGQLLLEGVFEQSRAQPADGERYTATASYTLAQAGMTSDVDVSVDCVFGGRCALEGALELPGIGSFTLHGDAQLSGEPAGWVELRGAETMRLDFDAIDADGCVPYTIDGAAAGVFCPEESEPEPEPTPSFGGGLGCSSDGVTTTFDFYALVDGEAASIDALLVRDAADPGTSLDLAFIDVAETGQEHWGGAIVTDGSCDATYRMRAQFADGSSSCLASGPDAARFAAEGCQVY